MRFVERIKLTSEKITQIDNLKTRVTDAIREIEGMKPLKVKQAGSWKKGTGLAPYGENPPDVDMVFFIEKEKGHEAEAIREELIDILRAAYPNKAREDFSNGEKTVGVVFRGTGLEADIAPFIPEISKSSHGTQPEKKLHNGIFMTSVDRQISRRLRKENMGCMVRILKHWRNEREIGVCAAGK